MTLRILFTLAILAGLAVAPSAQSFRWEPNSHSSDVSRRVERALEQARQQVERRWKRIDQQWQRNVERSLRADRQRAAQIDRQVRQRVERQVNAQLRAASRAQHAYRYDGRAAAFIERQTGTDADPCASSRDNDNDYRQHCEVRESTMPAGPLTVDAGDNGGITVEAWDGNDIRVRAIVRGSAGSDERAREIAGGVQVQASGGRISATGPARDRDRREWWSVSYRINVPRRNDLDLNANNGGITITGVNGNIRFDTTNGGVRLTDLGGRVTGSTRNGGLTVNLAGDRWDGDGITVETSNGGVTVAVPEGYNAQLETRTTNGGFRSDIPLTVQGELSSRRGVSAQLGSGGPTVSVRTTNGGLKISRR